MLCKQGKVLTFFEDTHSEIFSLCIFKYILKNYQSIDISISQYDIFQLF